MRRTFYARSALSALAILAVVTLRGVAQEQDPAKSGLEVFRMAAAKPASAPSPTFAAALLGGAGDVDEATRYLCAHSGGGDVVVLRASGRDDYNPYFHDLCPSNSVTTLLITSPDGARRAEAIDAVRNAHALFFAGGDQSNYLKDWTEALQQEINAAIARGVPVGGISAGLAVLGEFVFSARLDTITSPEAFANPFDPKLTLDRDFLRVPHLETVITDSHFSARQRLGRTLAFMSRIVHDGWAPRVRAIGIDESTAVLFDSGGVARVVGKNSAFFLELSHAPETCESGKALAVSGIEAYNLRASGDTTFDLKSWKPIGAAKPHLISVRDSQMTETH